MTHKPLILSLASLLLALAGTSVQAMSQQQAESLCNRYAIEDQIAADEKAGYMEDCVMAALNGEFGEPEAESQQERNQDSDETRRD